MSDMEPTLPLSTGSGENAPDPIEAALVAGLERVGQDLARRDVPGAAADAHLAAIIAAASQHAHVVPAATAGSSWTRRVRRVAGLTAVKVGLAAGVATAGTMGLAANDNLPEPVQRAVSDGASWFGVELPHPDAPVLPADADEEAHEHADLPTPPAPADVAPDTVPPAKPPHQGQDPDRVPTWAPTPPPFGPDVQPGPPADRDDAATDGRDRAPVDPNADGTDRPPVDPPPDQADNAEDRGAQDRG